MFTASPGDNPLPPNGPERFLPFLWIPFFLLLWQVLLRAENPGLNTDDSGEITAAAVGLGICHGPGYPLYSLLGRLFSFLPLGTPAFRLNLMSAVFVLLAVFFVLRTGRVLLRDLAPANPWRTETVLAITALSLLFCRSVFAQSLTSKGGLYTLLLLNLSVLLHACLAGPVRPRPHWILYFWALGMGAHWQTQVLWILFIAIRFRQLGIRWDARKFLVTASFVGIALSSLLYLPLRAHLSPTLNHFDPERIGPFLSLVLRSDVPGHDFILTDPAALGRVVLKYLEVMTWHWWSGFALFALLGGALLFRRQRGLAWGMTLQYVLLVILITLASFFNDARGIYLFGNILVSTQVIPAVFGALGIAALSERFGRFRPNLSNLFLALLLLTVSTWGYRIFRQLDKSGYLLAEDYGVNLLREMPRGALLLADDDLSVMPGHYHQAVLGLRPDVILVPLYKMHADWGLRELVERNRDRSTRTLTDFRDAVRCLTDPSCYRSSGFFYVYDIPILEAYGFAELTGRLVPRGLSFHLPSGPGDPGAVSRDVFRTVAGWRMRRLHETADLPKTEYTVKAYVEYYARPHVTAAFLLLKDGRLVEAVRHIEAALAIDPEAEGVNRGLAAHFAANGWLEMAERYAAREVRIFPSGPPNHILLGNILLKLGRWKEAIDAYGKALRLDPASQEASARLDMALAFEGSGAPSKFVQTHDRADYLELAEKFEKEGAPLLAREARATADSLE